MSWFTPQSSLRAAMHLLVGALSVAALAAVSSVAIADDWRPLSENDAKIGFIHPDFSAAIAKSFYQYRGFGRANYTEVRQAHNAATGQFVTIVLDMTNREDVYMSPHPVDDVMRFIRDDASAFTVVERGERSGLLGDYAFITFRDNVSGAPCTGFVHRWGLLVGAGTPSRDQGQDHANELDVVYCGPGEMDAVRDDVLPRLIEGVGIKGYRTPAGYTAEQPAAEPHREPRSSDAEAGSLSANKSDNSTTTARSGDAGVLADAGAFDGRWTGTGSYSSGGSAAIDMRIVRGRLSGVWRVSGTNSLCDSGSYSLSGRVESGGELREAKASVLRIVRLQGRVTDRSGHSSWSDRYCEGDWRLARVEPR